MNQSSNQRIIGTSKKMNQPLSVMHNEKYIGCVFGCSYAY